MTIAPDNPVKADHEALGPHEAQTTFNGLLRSATLSHLSHNRADRIRDAVTETGFLQTAQQTLPRPYQPPRPTSSLSQHDLRLPSQTDEYGRGPPGPLLPWRRTQRRAFVAVAGSQYPTPNNLQNQDLLSWQQDLGHALWSTSHISQMTVNPNRSMGRQWANASASSRRLSCFDNGNTRPFHNLHQLAGFEEMEPLPSVAEQGSRRSTMQQRPDGSGGGGGGPTPLARFRSMTALRRPTPRAASSGASFVATSAEDLEGPGRSGVSTTAHGSITSSLTRRAKSVVGFTRGLLHEMRPHDLIMPPATIKDEATGPRESEEAQEAVPARTPAMLISSQGSGIATAGGVAAAAAVALLPSALQVPRAASSSSTSLMSPVDATRVTDPNQLGLPSVSTTTGRPESVPAGGVPGADRATGSSSSTTTHTHTTTSIRAMKSLDLRPVSGPGSVCGTALPQPMPLSSVAAAVAVSMVAKSGGPGRRVSSDTTASGAAIGRDGDGGGGRGERRLTSPVHYDGRGGVSTATAAMFGVVGPAASSPSICAALAAGEAEALSSGMRPSARVSQRCFMLATAAVFVAYLSAFAPAALLPVIQPQLRIASRLAEAAAVVASGCSAATYWLMMFWLRQLGPRYGQVLVLLLTAPALACMALVNSGPGFILVRLVVGGSLGSLAVALFWIVTVYGTSPLLPDTLTACMAWGSAGAGVTMLLMPLLYCALTQLYDVVGAWHSAFYLPAAAHVLLAAATLFFGHDTAAGDMLHLTESGVLHLAPHLSHISTSCIVSTSPTGIFRVEQLGAGSSTSYVGGNRAYIQRTLPTSPSNPGGSGDGSRTSEQQIQGLPIMPTPAPTALQPLPLTSLPYKKHAPLRHRLPALPIAVTTLTAPPPASLCLSPPTNRTTVDISSPRVTSVSAREMTDMALVAAGTTTITPIAAAAIGSSSSSGSHPGHPTLTSGAGGYTTAAATISTAPLTPKHPSHPQGRHLEAMALSPHDPPPPGHQVPSVALLNVLPNPPSSAASHSTRCRSDTRIRGTKPVGRRGRSMDGGVGAAGPVTGTHGSSCGSLSSVCGSSQAVAQVNSNTALPSPPSVAASLAIQLGAMLAPLEEGETGDGSDSAVALATAAAGLGEGNSGNGGGGSVSVAVASAGTPWAGGSIEGSRGGGGGAGGEGRATNVARRAPGQVLYDEAVDPIDPLSYLGRQDMQAYVGLLLCQPGVLLLVASYSCCFGAQLVTINTLPIYLSARFLLRPVPAGAVACAVGALPVLIRKLVQWALTILMRRRYNFWTVRVQMLVLWAVQSAGGVTCALMGSVGGGSLSATVLLVLVFGAASQMACFMVLAAVPAVAPASCYGVTMQIVCGSGLLGAVLFQAAFFSHVELSHATGWLWMGVAVVAAAAGALLLPALLLRRKEPAPKTSINRISKCSYSFSLLGA